MDTTQPTVADWQRRLDLTVQTVREMSQHSDPEQMIQAYARRMHDLFPQDGMLSLSRRGLEWPRVRITRHSRWQQKVNPWKNPDKLPVLDGGILADLIYREEPRLIDHLDVPGDDPAAAYLEGFQSLLAVPHFHDGIATNMVVHLWKQPGSFDVAKLPDLVLTSNLFGRATYNLHLREELQRACAAVDHEMRAVAEIQRSLLPRELPAIPTLEMAAHYQTARRAGGDYYDLFPLTDGRWGIFIADVSGHGTPAAVMMAITHSIAHSYPGPGLPPGSMLDYVNEKLLKYYTLEIPGFVTAFYGVYEPGTHQLTYASAGHNPPRLRRRDGRVLALNEARGIPLGIAPVDAYAQANLELAPGDYLLLFTDGVTEVFDPQGDMFGYERLDDLLAHRWDSPQQLLDGVLATVEAFRRGHPLADDLTAMAVGVKE